MNDIVITVIVIIVSTGVLLIFPLVTTADRTDDITTQLVKSATTKFVDSTTATGKITQDNYDDLIQSISATGNKYDVEIEVLVLDDNPGKKVTEAEYTKVGENYYYSKYTTQILDEINSSSGAMYLKQGDMVYVVVYLDKRFSL